MNTLTREQVFGQLANTKLPRCVSLYIPTQRVFPAANENSIRFKNVISDAASQLEQLGDNSSEIESMLAPARALLDDAEFWQHQTDGLAVFLGNDFSHLFHAPTSCPDLAVVSDRFHLKPLMHLLTGDGRYYLLSLSKNAVRFWEGSRFELREVPVEELPESLAEALKYDDPESQLQFHTGAAPANGQRAAIYHGHGVGVDDEKNALLRYFRHIDASLQPILRTQRAPLVLAGVEYYFPIYRQANTYQHLLEEGVPGNPDMLTAEQLHPQAWALVEPYFQVDRKEAETRMREALAKGKASTEFRDILPAGTEGRIEVLFVPTDQHLWGRRDAQSEELQVHDRAEAGDHDLFDDVAVATLSNRGMVYAVAADKIPGDGDLAALFRY